MAERNWDPKSVYDASPEEVRAAQERAAARSELKAEFQKKLTNPMRGAQNGGYVFDPAIQRYMSMRATMYDHFRVTSKTSFLGFMLIAFPIIITAVGMHRSRASREATFQAGLVPYKDRQWKFI